MNLRIARSSRFGRAPRTRGGAALAAHRSPVMGDAEQEPRQHHAHGDFGKDARAAIVGAMELGNLSTKPPEGENLIDLHRRMVIWDQFSQRPGDEKLQPTPLLPPQHRSPSTTDGHGDSEAWGLFYGPR